VSNIALQSAYLLRAACVAIVRPFMALGPTWGLIVVSVLVGVLVLLVVRWTANQDRLRVARDGMPGALLGIYLFRHDTAVMFAEEWRLVVAAFRYMAAAVKPLLVSVVIVGAIMTGLAPYLSCRPLATGERALVTLRVGRGGEAVLRDAVLTPSPGIAVETPGLRIPTRGEVCWRIAALQPGEHPVEIGAGGATYSKEVVVGPSKPATPVSAARVGAGLGAVLFDSAEAPLKSAQVAEIRVGYPSAPWRLGPWRMHWLIGFLCVSMLAAVLLKGYLRVEL
jgi:hypothetical protein